MKLISLLLLVVGCASGSLFKLRLSNGRQDFAALQTTYTEITDTWLSPTIYMKHDKLPTFHDFIMTLIPNFYKAYQNGMPCISTKYSPDMTEQEFRVEIVREIVDVFGAELEVLRGQIIDFLFESKARPTLKNFATLTSRLTDLQFKIYEHTKSDCLFPILKGFVHPDLRFWLVGNDMDTVVPLTFLEYDSDTQLSEYYRFLTNLDLEMNKKLCGNWSVVNPFGMGHAYRAILKTDYDDYNDSDLMTGELLCKAMRLNVLENWDENAQQLHEIEKQLTDFAEHSESMIVVLFKSRAGYSKASEEITHRAFVPYKCAGIDSFYTSALQLMTELKTPTDKVIQYAPKTVLSPVDPAKAGSILQPLTNDLIVRILCIVGQQAYTLAPLVCKSFYFILANHPVDARLKAWRLAIPSNSIQNFCQAAILGELKKPTPDYEAFSSDLFRAIKNHREHLNVGAWTLPPNSGIPQENWNRMLSLLKFENKDWMGELLKMGILEIVNDSSGSYQESEEEIYGDVDDD